jgi:hypothetical protein
MVASHQRRRKPPRPGRDRSRRVQRRNERHPLHRVDLAVLIRGKQLLELIDHQDQARRRTG